MTHSMPANSAPTFPNPLPLLHIPFPISLKTAPAFCVVFIPACDCCRRIGSSYAKEADISEKKAPIPKPMILQSESNPRIIRYARSTCTASKDRLGGTRFHSHPSELLPLLGLFHLGSIFFSKAWGKRLLPWCPYWHLALASSEAHCNSQRLPLSEILPTGICPCLHRPFE